MSTTQGPTETSEDGRAFLQHRVAVAGAFGATVGFGFLTFRLLGAVFADAVDTTASYVLHGAGILSMALMWLVCRGAPKSIRVVRTAETVALFFGAISFSLMGLSVRPWLMPHHDVIHALSGVMFARAIYVPSTAKRTLILGLLIAVPVLSATYWIYHDVDMAFWDHIDETIRERGTTRFALVSMTFASAWWATAIALSTAASWVIYGLRKTVRNAKKLGQYDLIEKLGEGGMGMVYRAEHAMLRRPTAVKLLPPTKVGAQSLARFEKEVQQTARLTHPNTVTIFDYGRTPEGVFYYAMELLDGATLRQVVEADGPQPPARAAKVLEEASRALYEAHSAGLIHRDIKPANIMLVRQGGERDVTKVLDFGLVKELARNSEGSLTQADSITGTPQYLSPEAIADPDRVDARSDIYALGAVAYYLLAGRHVFSGNTVVEVCSKHLYESPTPIQELVDVPDELAALVMGCLEKEADARPQSARALADALRAIELAPWSEQDAGDWWERCGVTLQAQSRAPSAGDLLTIDVDVARREGRVI